MSNLKLYTLNELMKILQLSRPTIIRYIKRGDLKAFKIGNRIMVTKESLDQFIKNSENSFKEENNITKEEEILTRLRK